MDSVGIIGFGRFGRVLGKILSDDFAVRAYDVTPQKEQSGIHFVDQQTVLKEKALFVCVPIRKFKEIILNISERLSAGTTVIDVCSVKVYPVTVMTEALASHVGIIATHPLFGPDSIPLSEGLKMVMMPTRDVYNQFGFWKKYFESRSIKILEMSAEEHDRLAAKTQGVTHFVGRVLKEAGVDSTEIDTLGFRELLGVIDQTCNDSWELFDDLQNYNPYTLPMIEKLESSIRTIRAKIIMRK